MNGCSCLRSSQFVQPGTKRNELTTICSQLKLKTSDDKRYNTDVANKFRKENNSERCKSCFRILRHKYISFGRGRAFAYH